MSQTPQPEAPGSGSLEQQLRQRVERLTYLPASVSVAVRFIELGKNPDAGPAEYEKTISSDAALGTKILALANSSWYGVRNEVKRVLQAVNLLGLANIRALAISYCMAGLHNHMKIPKEDIKRYWQASLCKGVAAKIFANAIDPDVADEAFLAGLFQDIALPLIQSVADEPLLSILQDPECDVAAQLAREREAYGVDHSEVGRWLATKLELPDAYVDAVGFHHDAECLGKFVQPDALGHAMEAASVFPHVPDRWCPADVKRFDALFSEKGPEEFEDKDAFLQTVQKEFETLFGFFEGGATPSLQLADLINDACEEIADSTTRMVGQLSEMMSEAAKTGVILQDLASEHERLADESRLDALTGVQSRDSFFADAVKVLGTAGRRSIPLLLLYCDVDDFKVTNDTYGHHFGDFVLRELCSRLRSRVRKTDLLGRLGGDEFAILLQDIQADRARALVEPVVRSIREEPFAKGKVAVTKTISVGALWVPGSHATHDIDALLAAADTLMYQAKRSGPGQIRIKSWKGQGVADAAKGTTP